jgi:hypothetical protein
MLKTLPLIALSTLYLSAQIPIVSSPTGLTGTIAPLNLSSVNTNIAPKKIIQTNQKIILCPSKTKITISIQGSHPDVVLTLNKNASKTANIQKKNLPAVCIYDGQKNFSSGINCINNRNITLKGTKVYAEQNSFPNGERPIRFKSVKFASNTAITNQFKILSSKVSVHSGNANSCTLKYNMYVGKK